MFQDTIFALSSGALPSGVAVIRLSGPQVQSGLQTLVGNLPPPRQAVLRDIRADDRGLLDRGLVLFFPGPNSFTGEDCAELQIHGGRAVVSAILDYLASLDGFRPAEAGDFTRRAFLNGKMDLSGAEALADLIAAETETQRKLAIQNTSGRQRQLYDSWRTTLLRARAFIEAELDFADEDDVPGSVSQRVWENMRALAATLRSHIAGYAAAEIIREGFRVVLIGAPNAGKSSLLNALARREVAIVTDIPGTTRDLVEVSLDVRGLKVIVTDTAGIRETDDVVERLGVERAHGAARAADLVIHLMPADAEDIDRVNPLSDDHNCIVVTSKCDVGRGEHSTLAVSAVTGEGLEELLDAISSRAAASLALAESTIPTRLRHKSHLLDCLSCIDVAVSRDDLPLELRAEELRQAADHLGRITGTTDVEDLLGVIFSEFCIGK